MERKKIIKVIIIILMLCVIIFLVNTFRKFFILQEMQNNADIHISKLNFQTKVTIIKNDKIITTTNLYKKGNNTAVIINNNEEDTKTSLYYDDQYCDEFYENSESKIAKLKSTSTLTETLIPNYIQIDTKWLTFCASIKNKVKEVECNGKECYLITGNIASSFPLGSLDMKEMYFEKDTGLCIKIVSNNETKEEMEYNFDSVPDGIFKKPDVNEYEIIEKNS